MRKKRSESLKPRKNPRQRRATVTVDAIFEATIQVLVAHGFDKTSTARIAERAGVSVGTLYQYFPNKRALLAALVRRHVSEIVTATVEACESVHHKSFREMCAVTVNAFINAKTRRPEVSRALYLPAATIGGDAIVKEQSLRSTRAVHAMLLTANDARFAHPEMASGVLVSSVIGPTQAAIEAGGSKESFLALKAHLTSMCVGYLRELNLSTPG